MIGALDFETLDTVAYTTIVTDVGMAKIDTASRESLKNVTVMGLRLNVLDQLLRGRSHSQSTLSFHVQNTGSIEALYDHLQHSDFYASTNMVQALERIKEFFEDCSEIWINGTSFDPVVLTGLCDTYNLKFPYKYRKEIDVRTLRTKHEIGNVDKIECKHKYSDVLLDRKHDAISDACWNLKNAVVFEEMAAKWKLQSTSVS